MNCNCKWVGTVLALVILTVSIWPNVIGPQASFWVVVIAAVLLLLHAWMCKKCASCGMDSAMSAKRPKSKSKKRR